MVPSDRTRDIRKKNETQEVPSEHQETLYGESD